MDNAKHQTTVAIACQGGGMHAAFEVGVLTKVLEEIAKPESRIKLVGLSGTSAGALCALMTWYGLAPKNGRPGSAHEAISVLNHFWDKFVAETGAEKLVNALTVGAFKIAETEVPIFGLSAGSVSFNPGGLFYKAVTGCLPSFGIRKEYFDLDHVLKEACPHFASIDWAHTDTRLLVGASEVINGYETVFDSELNKGSKGEVPVERWRQRLPLSLAGVAASGTLPSVREAQHIEGCGDYWDGLYSQNPPLREFVENRQEAPNEIWVLRINPQQWPRLPETLGEIRDRENELMGNLSLHKDLDFIQKINKISEEIENIKRALGPTESIDINKAFEALAPLTAQQVTVRTIKLRKQTCDELQYSTKFNRSHNILNRLRDEGREVGEEWLRLWPGHVGSYPKDAGHQTTTTY
jgi:NTE family protein